MGSRTFLKILACSLSFSWCFFLGHAQPAKNNIWPHINKVTRPWTRWWWMGSAVDETNLSRLLNEYNRIGIGGVEIAPIYGALGYERNYIDYLSPKWMGMLSHTIKTANRLGMGVDLIVGTGWPFGGPQITPEYAATRLLVQTYTFQKGAKLDERIIVSDPKQKSANAELQAVTAYGDKGEVIQLFDKVDLNGRLNWSPASGNWKIYAAFSDKTRQVVKRAAPGGEGLTLDHFSKEALDVYLKRFDNAFKKKSPGVRAFYNDSYEVYNADWSPNFFHEFQKRRGYDLRNFLRELTSSENSETVARIKSDYRETMGEILLNNFTRPWSQWANQYKGLTKNQAHGSPGNLLDLYAAVDIPEGETFGSSYFPIPGLRRDTADVRNVDPDPVMLKFASSAANVTGKPLVSAETFTWLTEHFRTSLSQCKPEVEQLFLSGVNHVFYHGTTYSPEGVQWPGWLFYASVNMVPANSFWVHTPGLNDYITRCQSVLQAGKSDNELLVYWPIYDTWHNAKGMDMPFKVHDVDVWLHPTDFYRTSKALMGSGYSLDFISDNLLADAKTAGGKIITSGSSSPYKILIVPRSALMPVATFEKILRLAKEGATVVFQHLPSDVPGAGNLDDRRKSLNAKLALLKFSDKDKGYSFAPLGKGEVIISANVENVLKEKNILGEQLTSTGLKFIRRALNNIKFYYIVNHTPKAIDEEINLNAIGRQATFMDPQNGKAGAVPFSVHEGKTRLRVQLEPGEACILKVSDDTFAAEKWEYLERAGPSIELRGHWKLRFIQGGPDLPADHRLSKLISWTELKDDKAKSFSGHGEYTITFDLPSKTADDYVLDLGRVFESARVSINGDDVGIFWSFPFKARVGMYLKAGRNTMKIEVANLMANRISSMDKQGVKWRQYHEINFVNINYKSFDASRWTPMTSGLLGPVKIVPYEYVK